MESYLLHVCEKNVAMDRAMLDILSSLDSNILEEDRKAYYGSIKGIIHHILGGNTFFLGLISQAFPNKHLEVPAMQENMSFADLAQTILETDQSFIDFTRNLSTQEESHPVAFIENTIPLSELILKYYAHSTHHRGQISQILDSINIENDWSILS